MTARDIARAVQQATHSAVGFAEESLRRCETDGENLNAFITLCGDKALAQARRIDNLSESERITHPLAGVPIAIKDNISYTDYPMTCASNILEGYTPPYDATVITRLIAAGAVIVGKTNMDEFGMGSTSEQSCYGPVQHPHSGDLTPGGSSGGSASAVAAGLVPVALGSDTGGSVRQPASLCGLWGIKPTYGAVSRYGLTAFASSTEQISPLARTPEDLSLILSVMAGVDPHDATSRDIDPPSTSSDPPASRIAVLDISDIDVDPAIVTALDETVSAWEAHGVQTIPITCRLIQESLAAYYMISSAEASANLARFDGVRFGNRRKGDGSLEDMYVHTRSEGFGPEVKRRIMMGTMALSAGYREEWYLRALKVRDNLTRELEKILSACDAIVLPVTRSVAIRREEMLGTPLDMYKADLFTILASLSGHPALTFPAGQSDDGLPIGLQLISRKGADFDLIRRAALLTEVH